MFDMPDFDMGGMDFGGGGFDMPAPDFGGGMDFSIPTADFGVDAGGIFGGMNPSASFAQAPPIDPSLGQMGPQSVLDSFNQVPNYQFGTGMDLNAMAQPGAMPPLANPSPYAPEPMPGQQNALNTMPGAPPESLPSLLPERVAGEGGHELYSEPTTFQDRLLSDDALLQQSLNAPKDIQLTASSKYFNQVPDAQEVGTLNPKFNQTVQANQGNYQLYSGKSDNSYYARLERIESGGNPNARSPTGALGPHQFTRGTWKSYAPKAGVKPDPNLRSNPELSRRVVEKLTADNRATLRKTLGREPLPHEMYMAHNLGAGGAGKLIKSPPGTPVTASLIGSKPSHNPKFLVGTKGRTITSDQAVGRYRSEFYRT